MDRSYLSEDIGQIRRYFPGAQPVALQTPFDLTPRGDRPRLSSDTFRDTEKPANWLKDALWTSWT